MTRSRTLSISRAAVLVALVAAVSTPAASQTSADPGASPRDPAEVELTAVHVFRTDFNKLLDQYESVFQKLGNERGLRLTAEARERMQAVSQDQLEKLFSNMRVPDLAPALQATAALDLQTPVGAVAESAAPSVEGGSAGFPGSGSILSDCNNISHSSSFTFGALVAFQVVRTILAAAEFACEETIVILGEGGNAAAACIPLAIAQDVAAIPFELASFCAGEEDSAVLQGAYDRLEHIHTDLDAARTAIVNNNNPNKTEIINNSNANTTEVINKIDANTASIISNIDANTNLIVNNDNSNRTQIINNDNANRDAVINELRNLGCEIVRLLNTPEGQRASSALACVGQPSYPYNFPEKP